MAMPAAIDTRTASASARSRTSRIAGVHIAHDLSQVETVWRGLEDRQQFSTPYQRFDFLNAWQSRVGTRENLLPFIVVAHDAERRPLLLLPLVLSRKHGIRTARFMGGKHATFNMALWNRDFAAAATALDLYTLLSALHERSGADVLALHQQPKRWRDLPNPLAMLPYQTSVNVCPLLTMPPGAAPAALIGGSFRRRLRSKERKLQMLPGFRYQVAISDAEIKRLLDWFFLVKPLRMAEQKLPNVFAEQGVEDFIRDACMTPVSGGGRIIDIHALECDDEIIAIFAGVADGRRFSMMFNTYTMSASSRYSPGLILTRKIVDHYAAQGYRDLDLGVGSDGYKRFFCKSDEPIFDSFIPLSLRGKVAAAAMSAVNRTKYLVKHNQPLLQTVQKLRGVLR
ncbi:GNAT family N-acetyltransferase [Bradyrhizobium sp.]|jgi:CelD/BcsL family acetyltransferase involved in cellulose biosynthesis|uniref:GNAT family N-acetyltransferase n=1 Tax=Bradyrhizobium sp. TaxID=376 RepID=UPI003C13F33F